MHHETMRTDWNVRNEQERKLVKVVIHAEKKCNRQLYSRKRGEAKRSRYGCIHTNAIKCRCVDDSPGSDNTWAMPCGVLRDRVKFPRCRPETLIFTPTPTTNDQDVEMVPASSFSGTNVNDDEAEHDLSVKDKGGEEKDTAHAHLGPPT
jgi:hypothetical protein